MTPIHDEDDLKKALKAFGSMRDKGSAKRHITTRATELGLTSLLPAGWSSKAELAEETEADLVSDLDVALAKRVEFFNRNADPAHYVSLGKLKTVYRRGKKAYCSNVTEASIDEYALARVDAFLIALSFGGYPANDADLFPQIDTV